MKKQPVPSVRLRRSRGGRSSSRPPLSILLASLLWGCLVLSLSGSEPSSLSPGAPVEYGDLAFNPERWKERGLSTQLYPWTGQELVFLTSATNFNHRLMARFIDRLDRGWSLYTELTGQSPGLFKQWRGKPLIAAVPEASLTCGYGCGFIGATGIEVAGFYDHDYPLFRAETNAFPHYYFYEMGRNFYTFGDRHSCFITGYAVFMRYVCMDALRCADPDRSTREIIEKAEALYAASDMHFIQAFTTEGGLEEKAPRLKRSDGRPLQPSDQPVLYASAMLKLRREYGGDAWVKRFFAALAKCPEIKPEGSKAALRQSLSWLVAASCAARRDVSALFVDRWRLPLENTTRRALAEIQWDSPETDPAAVLGQLPGPAGSP